MVLPSEGLERVYWNQAEKGADFFNEGHKDHYIILNLSQKRYNFGRFNNMVVVDFGFFIPLFSFTVCVVSCL
jgi:hypothetical protein